ncbi:MAG: energy-coupling factor transporter ATPase [Clostridia bacterium]|nr:energy-coupling factor transporter ATPase [Clostridia bacterium]
MGILTLENVSYVYSPSTPFEKEALHDVNIDFTEGKITGIIGHTGSGKSTVAQLLNGLLKPASGKVLLDGCDIFDPSVKLSDVRFRVGLVFQYPEYQLFEETVFRDIAFGPTNMGLDEAEIKRRVIESARFAGLDEELLGRSPFELSGGQKRRAAIAGVMAMEPEVIVLDEPAAGLDPRGRDEILSGIRRYRDEKGNTVILISHSMEDMALYSDELVVMSRGTVLVSGTVDEVFRQSALIEESGLTLPQITRVFDRLRADGVNIRDGVYTVEDGYREMLSLLKGNTNA